MQPTLHLQKVPTIATRVQQLVLQCTRQAQEELRETTPKHRSYGGHLGTLQPYVRKGQSRG